MLFSCCWFVACWSTPCDNARPEDLSPFPCEDAAVETLKWQGEHRRWLEAQSDLHAWDGTQAYWQRRLKEQARHEEAWKLLRMAHYQRGLYDDGNAFPYWREIHAPQCADYLTRLKQLIGKDAYRLGQMPPPADPACFTQGR